MEITVEDILSKQQACLKQIDKNKNCNTCKYNNSYKCDTCYDELLCLPVNPTNWEGKNES